MLNGMLDWFAAALTVTLCNFIKYHIYCGAVAERLRYRSREQRVASSSPRSDISVEVTSQC